MKKLFLAAIAALTLSTAAEAQPFVNNNSACDVYVRQYCYDAACNLVSANMFTVPAFTVGFPIAPPCNPGDFTVYDVCWVPNGCGPFIPCTTVDGTAAGISPCGPGTYNGVFQSCDYCALNNGTGLVNVDYDPTLDELNITP